MHQLSRFYDVSVIVTQDKISFEKSGEEYPEMKTVKVHSSNDYSAAVKPKYFLPKKYAQALHFRFLNRNLFAKTDSNFFTYYRLLKQLMLHEKFDLILIENLATLYNAGPLVKRWSPHARIIYNAHNVDSHLTLAALKKGEGKLITHQRVLAAEQVLHRLADAVITCSSKDLHHLQELNNNRLVADVIPNGAEIHMGLYNTAVQSKTPSYILFCGALWTQPNSEGLHWFCTEIWPEILLQFPQLKLLVVGSGKLPEKYRHLMHTPAAEFTGTVADVKEYYNKASAVVVPLLTGSGTRLKILEAMALGMPVISTAKGAEGIDCVHEENIILADDRKSFTGELVGLLQNAGKRVQVGKKAKEFIEATYNWNVIGSRMKHFFDTL